MSTEKEYQSLLDRVAALRETLASRLAPAIYGDPRVADALVKEIDDQLNAVLATEGKKPVPPDKGLAQLIGLGPEAATSLGSTRVAPSIEPYDETVVSERLIAIADFYYVYQHEKVGVFRVVKKLQELFKAGTIYLSAGPGAYALYQFDRRDVLRYTERERLAAYRRAFGYGSAGVPSGSRANSEFHPLFVHFNNEVSLFWRDKRISDVIRERAYDPSFGSIAVVRRAGLDLRNNVKFTSYGDINVLRVELLQLLDEAFRILDADDVKKLFGAENFWDVVEIMLTRYWNERLETSPRQRMAIAGREVLRWLAQPHILKTDRAEFETLLLEIAEYSEEWLTSAQSLGLARRASTRRVVPWEQRGRMTSPTGPPPGTPAGRTLATAGRPG
jgi:hypothetical protein